VRGRPDFAGSFFPAAVLCLTAADFFALTVLVVVDTGLDRAGANRAFGVSST